MKADFVFMATANGTVKKTPLERFSRPRTAGLIALRLEPGNTLVSAAIIDSSSDVLLVSSSGKAARFRASAVRAVGRTARGVRGIRLTGDHSLIALIVPKPDGYAADRQRTRLRQADQPSRSFRSRAAVAKASSPCVPELRNGDLIGAVQVFADDEIMLISDHGTLVRTHAADISQTGRNTQGVRLIKLSDDAKLVGVERIVESVNGDAGDAGDVDDATTPDADEIDPDELDA